MCPLSLSSSLLTHLQVLESTQFVGSPGVTNTGRWVGNSGVETLVVSNPYVPARYNALSLEVVGSVSAHDFYMDPHGDWTPAFPHPYHDHVGMFALEGLGSQIVAMTWDSVLANIKILQGDSPGNILALPNKLVFTHRLFRVRIPVSTSTFAFLTYFQRCSRHHNSRIAKPFQMRHWPSDTDDQKACTLAMAEEGTWTPQPLPLYDHHGRIVKPRNYSSTLPGSLVHVKFNLTRKFQPATSHYLYLACVEEINIIHPTEIDIGTASHDRLVDSVRTRSPTNSPSP